jgi:DHA2 family lincomycin resistance protein-like MFS transporter
MAPDACASLCSCSGLGYDKAGARCQRSPRGPACRAYLLRPTWSEVCAPTAVHPTRSHLLVVSRQSRSRRTPLTSATDSSQPATAGASLETDSLPHAARNKLVINLLLVSTFVAILNETVMSVAIPRLMGDLGIPATSAQWLTTAFLLTMAVVIPITGLLIQRFHTRHVFLVAMSLFVMGTVVATVSPGFELLLVARVIQASGTALMVPLLMTTAMTLEPPETRGRRMGSITVVISVAPAIGPTISGLVLNALPWRFLFAIILPVAVAALIVGAVRMPNVTEPRPTPIDALSVVLSAIGFGGLVFGLSHLGESGGTLDPTVVASLVVGVLAVAVFIHRQTVLARHDRALLDLRAFKTPTFTLSVAVFAVVTMSFFGALILLPIYMQNVLGLTVLQSGLILLPGGLAMGLTSPPIGRLYDWFGPRPLLIPGTVCTSVALGLMTLLRSTTPWWALLPLHLVLSIGLSLIITPLFSASLGSLPERLYSYGSAIVGTAQQVAGAVGIAVFVSTMTVVTTRQVGGGASAPDATAAGVNAAFLIGASVSLLSVIASCFIRKANIVASSDSAVREDGPANRHD